MSGDGPGGLAATLALADWRRAIGTLYADVRRLAATDPAVALAQWRDVRERLYREHPQSPVPAGERATFRARHFDHDPGLRFEVAVEPLEAAGPAAGPVGGAIDFGGGAETGTRERTAAGLAERTGAGLAEGTGAGAAEGTGAATATAAGTGAGRLAIDLPVSAGGVMAFARFGAVTIPFPAAPRRLEVYWMEGYAGGLFLPFRDATNGTETYGAGRYLLDAAKGADLGGERASGTLIVDFNFAFQPSCAFDPKWACPLAPPSNRLDLPVRAGERLA